MKTLQWMRLLLQLLVILRVLAVSLRMSRPSSRFALRSGRQFPHCVHSSSRAVKVASLRSGVQEQRRGATDVRVTTASKATFLSKLWDNSLGRVWTALINVVKGIFGKKNESFGLNDSPVTLLSKGRASVLPPSADVAITEVAAFDEGGVSDSVRQKEKLLEARRFVEQKLREIDGRPRRVVAGLQPEMSNHEAADAAEDVAPNYVDGILPSAELTTAIPKNGPDEEATAATDYGTIDALSAMPEGDTTAAVGYGALDALSTKPDEEAIAATEYGTINVLSAMPEEDMIVDSEVTSDSVIHDMFVYCCDVIASAI